MEEINEFAASRDCDVTLLENDTLLLSDGSVWRVLYDWYYDSGLEDEVFGLRGFERI